MHEAIGLPLPWGIVPAERNRVRWVVPDPAAGTDWSVPVPGGKLWIVWGFRAVLTTSAAVAARSPRVAITVAGLEVETYAAAGSPAASQVTTIGGGIGAVPGASNAANRPGGVGLASHWLEAGDTFGIVTEGLQAADTWTGIRGISLEYDVRGLERAYERYVRKVAEATGVAG